MEKHMNRQNLPKILSVISMLCGILAPCLVCYWYVGLLLALVAIGLGIYVQKHFGRNRMIITAYICAGIYVVFFLMLAAGMGVYYHMINLHK